MAFVDLNRSVKLVTKMMRRPSFSLKKNKKRKSSKNIKSQVIEGVYHEDAYKCGRRKSHHNSFSTLDSFDMLSIDDDETIEFVFPSSSTLSQDQQQGSTSKDSSSSSPSWVSSGSPSHHSGAPRLVRSTTSQRNLNLSDDEVLGRIMLRSRTLPRQNHGYVVSNHVMINNERTKRTLAPLKRKPSLDEIAKEHAMKMANEGQLIHPNLDDLQQEQSQPATTPTTTDCCSYGSSNYNDQRLGANVGCGPNIEHIQMTMISSESNLNNIIDRRFVYMGIGTANSSDGSLYLCQIFGN